jgi:purine-binding chemotaxis protein CheW
MSTVAVLICTVGRATCALPLVSVVETMRPLPVEAIAHAPHGVLGVSVIRGATTVVVDGKALLGQDGAAASRFVTLRAGDRTIALAVQEVRGVEHVPADVLHELPPLLRDAESIERIGARDRDVLLLLQASRLLAEVAEAP